MEIQMRHAAKIDWWIVLAVLVGTLAPLPSHTYWASGMVLGILLAGAYPQSYETTPRGLLIRSGFTRRLVPYPAITFVGPATEGAASVALSRDRVKVGWGPCSEVLIAPAHPASFFADLAARAPQLVRRGPDLVAVA
jgi:hypothetical protein